MSKHLTEWQPLSIRYGHHDPADEKWADKLPWGSRHWPRGIDPGDARRPAKPLGRCSCSGHPGQGHCVQRATQEDWRCDECRAWCAQ